MGEILVSIFQTGIQFRRLGCHYIGLFMVIYGYLWLVRITVGVRDTFVRKKVRTLDIYPIKLWLFAAN